MTASQQPLFRSRSAVDSEKRVRTHKSSVLQMSSFFLFFLSLLSWVNVEGIPMLRGMHVEDRDHWLTDARSHIEHLQEAEKLSKGRAKNIIMFVGDGMGLSTVTAGRILRGQQLGQTGEEYKLAFEKFPYVALAKTYTIDSQIGDSSACATALMCGVKANINTVGLDHRGRFENCFSTLRSQASSIIDWAQNYGKSTGIVTNTRLTHGTPSALYSHSASRYWEDDSKMTDTAKASFCKDIARQLVEDDPGKNINVLLGGGRRHWIPNTEYDREARTEQGRRKDGRNLIDFWVHDKKDRDLHAEYVVNKAQFDEIDPRKTDYLLGLFGYSHLDFEVDRNKGPSGDPSLAEMTIKAIQILQRNPRGFFLMVEAGRIDHAHHHNNGRRALLEVGSLEDAVVSALNLTSSADTLTMVTADHSHVFTFGGNAPRGHPVNGFDSELSDLDFKPYTTLLYANGPGYAHSTPAGRQNLTGINPEDINFVQQAAVPRKYESHSGEDVPVYAQGPGSHLFSGTVEQSYIPHAIAFAACMSPNIPHCEQPHSDDASAPAVPRPLYPRQDETPNHHEMAMTPASYPVEERKRPHNMWTWVASGSVSIFKWSWMLVFMSIYMQF